MKIKAIIVSLILTGFVFSCDSGSKKLILRKVPRSQRKALMVLNFKNNTVRSSASEFKPWEFGIASMVMTDIESIGLFNIISRERMKDILREQEIQLSGLVDPRKAVKLGKVLAAKYILSGSFMVMRGVLRMEAQVFSIETGSQLGAAAVTGKTDTFFDMEKQLVIKISKFLNAMLTLQEASRLAKNIETKSVNASLSNYKGELAYMKSLELKEKGKSNQAKTVLETARESFKKALKYDPNYERAKENLSKISLAIPVTL